MNGGSRRTTPMDNLVIAATQYTPEIRLDAVNGIISMKGKSYPENTFDFYQPVITWVEAYLADHCCAFTRVDMEIIYFNSSSSKLFFDLFDTLEEAVNAGQQIEVNWIFDKENEAAEEAGEDFRDDFTSLKVHLVSK
jgi:hypothetical protein